MNEQELAADRRLRDAIIHKSDKNQEMRILVIYPKITTYPPSILSEYKGGRKNKKPKDTKKKKVMPKSKPTRRIRLRFP